ncbi:MAG: glucose-6-phosphate isomerase, partial [Bacteroidia bacterium]
MTSRTLLTDLPAFAELQKLAGELKNTSIAQLFHEDTSRVKNYTVSAAGLTLDFSKHLLTRDVIDKLLLLAEQAQISAGIAALLSGQEVNITEGRPALHTLLRASSSTQQKFSDVAAARVQIRNITTALHAGNHLGFTGKPITDVVNIGIGGSDLGPRLATEALTPFHGKLCCHYVANVDPADLQGTLTNLDPATTLFIVCSKSFRTEETLANSLAARQWILAGGANEADLNCHFLAVTTNLAAAADFGIAANNCLPMWDWVGGRYSVWSAVGLSVAIAIGWDNFEDFLAGAETMDKHFSSADPVLNLPLLMSLMEIWYCNFHDADGHAVLPYDHSLKQLPDFLQQLTMESNGKRISSDGQAIDYGTAPILWGSAGTLGQHSFHQLLHQGTEL